MVRKSRVPLSPSTPLEPVTTSLTPKALTRQEFGRRVFERMNAKEWNQSDLARAAGVGRDSVSKYINGRSWPTPRSLRQIAKALGCQPHDLMPNEVMSAYDDEHPAIELKQAPGHPTVAWLRLNRQMSFGTAARIIAMVEEEDSKREAAD